MQILEIWFERVIGTPFELELGRHPVGFEYEKREATTYLRRTAKPWVVYTFRFFDDINEDIVSIAEAIEHRYHKDIRVYRMRFNTVAAPSISD